MKIIISPAKKMNIKADDFLFEREPVFLQKTEILMNWIKNLSIDEKKELWKCNNKILALNAARFENMDLHKYLTPAVYSFEGIQYQYMSPHVMETDSLNYLRNHLFILSAFYGVLGPFDGVVPYRLEMQAKLEDSPNLYDFWKDDIYNEITKDDSVIMNLASKEYSKAVEPYLQPVDRFVTCVFGELVGEKVVQKGTMAKMARGEMVNYLASVQAEKPEDAISFNRLGYEFQPAMSDDRKYVFLKNI